MTAKQKEETQVDIKINGKRKKDKKKIQMNPKRMEWKEGTRTEILSPL